MTQTLGILTWERTHAFSGRKGFACRWARNQVESGPLNVEVSSKRILINVIEYKWQSEQELIVSA